MYIMFPIEWKFGDDPSDGQGGPPVENAGTIYILRDENVYEDWINDNPEGLVKKTSLLEMVTECLDGCRDADGFSGIEHVPALDALAKALRDAADMLYTERRPE
jgi:hypothetical protein